MFKLFVLRQAQRDNQLDFRNEQQRHSHFFVARQMNNSK